MLTLALFLFSLSAQAQAPSDPAWLALLHAADGPSSVAADSDFFLDSNGAVDAAAEWKLTRALFAEDKNSVCRYPARAIYFGLKPEGSGSLCERFARFREAISAKGIELVFASAYLDSPSSMYGHTLLKFPRGGKTEGAELLDYTLNYGADTGAAAGIPYVWKGLTGGFNGSYATAPFYLKVREYNHVENRDFWIYPLRAKDPELEMLVAHAWELRNVSFPYFFLRRNCAFYLLEFLEVARPGAHLAANFPLWAVPMDTVRRLKEAGWLGGPRQRPSRRKRLKAMAANLTAIERARAKKISAGELGASGAAGPVLDAAYELWRYRTDSTDIGAAEKALAGKILTARAKAGASPALGLLEEQDPADGHPTSRITIMGGAQNHGSFGEISYRPALHDATDPPLGYEPSSELRMAEVTLRVDTRLYLERFDLLRLRSLKASDSWFRGRAWSFRIGAARAKEMECQNWRCVHGVIEGGMGKSLALGPGFAFAILELGLDAGAPFHPHYRISAGPNLGLFMPLSSSARLLLDGDWRWRLLGEKRAHRAARLQFTQDLSRSFGLRLGGEVWRSGRELKLGGAYYF